MTRKLLAILLLLFFLPALCTGCSIAGRQQGADKGLQEENGNGEADPGEDATEPPAGEAPQNDAEYSAGDDGNDGDTGNNGKDGNDGDAGDNGEHAEELLTDSGTYIGRIDANFIEIKISGVPEEFPARIFRLAEDIKETFEQYAFQTGDQVLFTYISKGENENPVITSIEIIKN